MSLSLNSIIKKTDHQVSCELDGEVAILNLKTSLYFGLNRVGATVWNALEEPREAEDVCAAVYQRFEVEEVQCRNDVLDLLAKLENAGLVEVVDR